MGITYIPSKQRNTGQQILGTAGAMINLRQEAIKNQLLKQELLEAQRTAPLRDALKQAQIDAQRTSTEIMRQSADLDKQKFERDEVNTDRAFGLEETKTKAYIGNQQAQMDLAKNEDVRQEKELVERTEDRKLARRLNTFDLGLREKFGGAIQQAELDKLNQAQKNLAQENAWLEEAHKFQRAGQDVIQGFLNDEDPEIRATGMVGWGALNGIRPPDAQTTWEEIDDPKNPGQKIRVPVTTGGLSFDQALMKQQRRKKGLEEKVVSPEVGDSRYRVGADVRENFLGKIVNTMDRIASRTPSQNAKALGKTIDAAIGSKGESWSPAAMISKATGMNGSNHRAAPKKVDNPDDVPSSLAAIFTADRNGRGVQLKGIKSDASDAYHSEKNPVVKEYLGMLQNRIVDLKLDKKKGSVYRSVIQVLARSQDPEVDMQMFLNTNPEIAQTIPDDILRVFSFFVDAMNAEKSRKAKNAINKTK